MTPHREWSPIFKVGGVATLIAALFFRRNTGAKVSLFTIVAGLTHMVTDCFNLL